MLHAANVGSKFKGKYESMEGQCKRRRRLMKDKYNVGLLFAYPNFALTLKFEFKKCLVENLFNFYFILLLKFSKFNSQK